MAYTPNVLASAQTGNFTSTAASRNSESDYQIGGAVVITSAIGATPTVTVNIQGSVDGVNYFNIPYALVATPTTFVLTALTITTAVTTSYLLQGAIPWTFVQIVASANTNVTLTATAYL
jgi:hypothetical protein